MTDVMLFYYTIKILTWLLLQFVKLILDLTRARKGTPHFDENNEIMGTCMDWRSSGHP